MNNLYQGVWNDGNEYVKLNGIRWDHRPSLKIRNHSPDGFSWGYCGSGSAQLALAIVLNETNDAERTQRYYHEFMRACISNLPQHEDFTITGEDVAKFMENRK